MWVLQAAVRNTVRFSCEGEVNPHPSQIPSSSQLPTHLPSPSQPPPAPLGSYPIQRKWVERRLHRPPGEATSDPLFHTDSCSWIEPGWKRGGRLEGGETQGGAGEQGSPDEKVIHWGIPGSTCGPEVLKFLFSLDFESKIRNCPALTDS